MNADLVPAVVAGGVGSAMLGGIGLHEFRQAQTMRSSRVRLALRFPMALDPVAAKLALSAISGVSERMELVFEVAVTGEGVTHAVLVPQAVRASVVSGLTAAIPSMSSRGSRAEGRGKPDRSARVRTDSLCACKRASRGDA